MKVLLLSLLLSIALCVYDVDGLQCRSGAGVDMTNVANLAYYQNQTCSDTVGDQQCFIGEMTFSIFTVPTKVSYGGCIGKAISSSVTCEAILGDETALNVDLLYPSLVSSIEQFIDKFSKDVSKNFALLVANNTGPYSIDMVAVFNDAFKATGWTVDEKLYPLMEELPSILFGMADTTASFDTFLTALKEVDTEDVAIGNQLRKFLEINSIVLPPPYDDAALFDRLPIAVGIFFYKTKEDFLKNAQPIFNMLEKFKLTDQYATNFAMNEMMYHYMAELWSNDQMTALAQSMCPPTTTTQPDADIQKRICELLQIDYKELYTQMSNAFGNADISNADSIKAIFTYPLSAYFNLNSAQQSALTDFLTSIIYPLNPPTNAAFMDVAFSSIAPQSGQNLYVELKRVVGLDETIGMIPKASMIVGQLLEMNSVSTYLDTTYQKFTQVMAKVEYGNYNFTAAVQEFSVLYADDFSTIETALNLEVGDIQGVLTAVSGAIAQVTNFSDPVQLSNLPLNIIKGLEGVFSEEGTAALQQALNSLYSGEDAETVTGHINDFLATVLPAIPQTFMEKLSNLLESSGVENYQIGLQGVYQTMVQLYMQNENYTVTFLNQQLPKWGAILDGFGGNVFTPNYVTLKSAINTQYPEIADQPTVQTIIDSLPESYPLLISFSNTSKVLQGIKIIIDRINPNNEHGNAAGNAAIAYYDAMSAVTYQVFMPEEYYFLIRFSFQIPYFFADIFPEGDSRNSYVEGVNLQNDLQRIQYELQTAFYRAIKDPNSVDMTVEMDSYFDEYETLLKLTKGTITVYTKPATAVATEFSRIDFTMPDAANQKVLELLKTASDNYKVSFPDNKFPVAFSGLMDVLIKITKQEITTLEDMFDELYVVVKDFASAFSLTEDTIAQFLSTSLPQFAPFWNIFTKLSEEEKKSSVYFLVNMTIDAVARPETLQSNIEEFVKGLLGNVDVKQELITILGTSKCKTAFCDDHDLCNTDEALSNAPTYTVPPPDSTTKQPGVTQPPDEEKTTSGSSTTFSLSLVSVVTPILVAKLL